jgi:hypothetical protein
MLGGKNVRSTASGEQNSNRYITDQSDPQKPAHPLNKITSL